MAYGVTTNHVLAIEVVLPDGEITWFGDFNKEVPGVDFRGLFIGSEGTFGICTKVVVKLLQKPQDVKTILIAFSSIQDAANATTAIIGAGIIPAAIELMDKTASDAAEAGTNAGIPQTALGVRGYATGSGSGRCWNPDHPRPPSPQAWLCHSTTASREVPSNPHQERQGQRQNRHPCRCPS